MRQYASIKEFESDKKQQLRAMFCAEEWEKYKKFVEKEYHIYQKVST